MKDERIDPQILHAWLYARSIARGLPAPVSDHGGYRVDTNSDTEVRRWVFPKICIGLVSLARAIKEPRHVLKLCGGADVLRSVLSDNWQLHELRYFMQGGVKQIERPMLANYAIEVEHNGPVIAVRIRSDTGELAARGYAAETQNAFIYDRIATMPEHRRRGLASAVMATLRRAKSGVDTPELLVATEDGRALYTSLGWRTISAYSTASLVGVYHVPDEIEAGEAGLKILPRPSPSSP